MTRHWSTNALLRLLPALILTSCVVAASAVSATSHPPCPIATSVQDTVTKAMLTGYTYESATMQTGSRVARPGRSACAAFRNEITITDTQPGQSGYAYSSGVNSAAASQVLRYYDPKSSDPTAAPWISTGAVTFRFETYSTDGHSTLLSCVVDVWEVTSAQAQRLNPTPMTCPA